MFRLKFFSKQALKKASENAPDAALVLTSVGLSMLTGYEMHRQQKAAEAANPGMEAYFDSTYVPTGGFVYTQKLRPKNNCDDAAPDASPKPNS